jgi:hypothetical protein
MTEGKKDNIPPFTHRKKGLLSYKTAPIDFDNFLIIHNKYTNCLNLYYLAKCLYSDLYLDIKNL